jgi:GntR family transcriptional regulator
MEFQIDAAGREPVYRQIVEQVRNGVARGWISPHDQLPSSRELARTLVINPNTVVHAYAELERQGIVYGRPGMGVFVAEPKGDLTKAARRRCVLDALDRFLTEAVHQGFSEAEVRTMFSARVEHFQWGPCKEEAK